MVIGAFGFSIFAIAVAVAKDLQTVMIARFFGGLFGSCPLAVVAAAFADMFNNKVRGLAVAVFAATVFMGPLLAPFVSRLVSLLSQHVSYNWIKEVLPALVFYNSLAFLLNACLV